MTTNLVSPMPEETPLASLPASHNRITITLITLLGALLRLWRLGDLGLSYDEAATALMARATPAEIVHFHWTAGFEHPPFWQLLIHAWSLAAAQSEFALRFLPALAGILVIPLVWQFAHVLYPDEPSIWHSSALLTAMAPVLIYYSQEARMYAIVLVLALGAMIVSVRLVKRPSWSWVFVLALLNVAMTGFHYYAALIFAAQGLYFLISAITQPAFRSQWVKWLTALVLSTVPLLAWMAFSPGFQMTLESVLHAADVEGTPATVFLNELWRDLTVAAIRWQPAWTWIGYLWLPLLAVGLADALWLRRKENWSRLSGWYLALLLIVPVLFSALVFGQLSTRYVLYIGPALFILMAMGIVRLWSTARFLGAAGALLFVGVCLVALIFYRTDYAKSEYREMSASIEAHIGPQDAVLIESPRQHLTAKYYLDDTLSAGIPLYPVPAIELPTYWPVNAPPVVPEEVDGDIQRYLQQHPTLWLSLTAQNEVDPGEFLAKYLTAVAYQVDCTQWLDVDLCRYASPAFVEPQLVEKFEPDSAVRFDGGLELQGVQIARLDVLPGEEAHLLVELDWLATERSDTERPDADYKVSLRLTDPDGVPVSQSDNYPIGPLLPPTTWGAGDRKPGYQALAVPAGLEPGQYELTLSLYDPSTLVNVAYSVDDSPASAAPFLLANVLIGDTIELE